MAERLYYCDTCDIHLTGPQPAMQHYSGSRHRKKEAVKAAQSSSVFLAPVDASMNVNYTTAGSDRRAGSLDLSSALSSYSVDCTMSENTLKSVEIAPTCNVVMVPSSNPDLPPVPVTMMENAIPQTEYEFDGSSGSCFLCGTELTSQQHADQHLSGQKHVKAKRRWESRRDQLQATVSGLSTSMKSKPIAMCQPLVCETPAKDYISDIISKHNSSESAPALTAAVAAAKSTSVVDRMQWFSCDVCNKQVNTVEMLELHKRSPAHLKKAERQQSGAVSGDNTVWQTCPICQKRLNSLTQLEIHMTNHSRPTDVPNCPPASLSAVATPDGQWHHCHVCNKYMNTAVQLELHRQSPAHQKVAVQREGLLTGNVGDNTVWQTCTVCNKRLNSLKQLDIHMKSHGLSGRSLLNDTPSNDVDCLYRGTENQLTFTAVTEGLFTDENTTLFAAEKISPSIEFGQKIDAGNLSALVDELQIKEETSQGDVEMLHSLVDNDQLNRSRRQETLDDCADETPSQTELSSDARRSAAHDAVVMSTNLLQLVKTEGLDLSQHQTRQTSSENSGGQITDQAEVNSATAAAADDDDGDDKDGVMMAQSQPMSRASLDSKVEWTSNNLTSPATCDTDVNSASSAAAAAEKLVTDDDLITTGCCASVSCVYHCELCNVHLSGDEPRSTHLTGNKHILCRQKAEETTSSDDNPFSPNFRYFCQLCNVPYNTLRDKRQHERGQQHISKSVRCVPAPHRLLPHLVLPTNRHEDNCMPDSLVTSKPRSYQEELYFKAVVDDSICFLPTGSLRIY